MFWQLPTPWAPFGSAFEPAKQPVRIDADGLISVLADLVADTPAPLIYLSQWELHRIIDRKIIDNAHRLASARPGTHRRKTTIYQLMPKLKDWYTKPASDYLDQVTGFGGIGTSGGTLDFIEGDLDRLTTIFLREKWRPDIAIVHTSAPRNGMLTLASSAGLDFHAVREARIRVAVVNRRAPFFATGGSVTWKGVSYERGCPFRVSDFDYVMEIWHEPEAPKEEPLTREEEELLTAIASRIPRDHLVMLQVGISKQLKRLLKGMDGIFDDHQFGIFSELLCEPEWRQYLKLREKHPLTIPDVAYASFVAGRQEFLDDLDEKAKGRHLAIYPSSLMVNEHFIAERCPGPLYSIQAGMGVNPELKVFNSGVGGIPRTGRGGSLNYSRRANATGRSFVVLPGLRRVGDGFVPQVTADPEPDTEFTLTTSVNDIFVPWGAALDIPEMTLRERILASAGLCHESHRAAYIARLQEMPKYRRHGLRISEDEAINAVDLRRQGLLPPREI